MAFTVQRLIARGYFPAELPPPFTTTPFARAAGASPATLEKLAAAGKPDFKLCRHNLARVGMLRRVLGIPNPAPFLELASFVVAKWPEIRKRVDRSRLSRSTPVVSSKTFPSDRAIERTSQQSDLTPARAKLRAGRRHLLVADISRFYGSIYTHCIPWAIHGKKSAKADRSDKLWGNKLDRLLRRCQDNQTIGIPIGPDTSLVVAELLLSAVDTSLPQSFAKSGFRYMDDYELAYFDRPSAVAALSRLEGALADFELELNSTKTSIDTLPQAYEESWVAELRSLPLDAVKTKEQHYQLVRFSTRAFELATREPTASVLNWSIARLAGVKIDEENWPFAQAFMLQCIAAEPGTLKFASEFIPPYVRAKYRIDRTAWSQVAADVIQEHSTRRHGSEVAWMLWISILLNLKLRSGAVSSLRDMNDSVVALLALDAQRSGLIGRGEKFTAWRSRMTTDELRGDQWLLVYEAAYKKWLPSVGGKDHIAASPFFDYLRNKNVYFYKQSAATEIIERAPPPGTRVRRLRQLAKSISYGFAEDNDSILKLLEDF